MDALDRLDQTFDGNPETWIGPATVTNAAAGTFPDGRKKITVNWNGTSVDAGYQAWYTPTNGDVVTFLKSGTSFWVLGKSA